MAKLSYDMLDSGEIFADYGKSGFNFENCRRYVFLSRVSKKYSFVQCHFALYVTSKHILI